MTEVPKSRCLSQQLLLQFYTNSPVSGTVRLLFGGFRAGSVHYPLPSSAFPEFLTLRVVSWGWCCEGVRAVYKKSYLVDPASSHMLVSKIKPCMSKYKQLYTVKLRTAHYISNNLFDGFLLHG